MRGSFGLTSTLVLLAKLIQLALLMSPSGHFSSVISLASVVLSRHPPALGTDLRGIDRCARQRAWLGWHPHCQRYELDTAEGVH